MERELTYVRPTLKDCGMLFGDIAGDTACPYKENGAERSVIHAGKVSWLTVPGQSCGVLLASGSHCCPKGSLVPIVGVLCLLGLLPELKISHTEEPNQLESTD